MNREETIFSVAVEMSPENRSAYLDQVCEGDFGLVRRVEALLNGFEDAGSFLEEAATPDLELTTRALRGIQRPFTEASR